MKLLSPINKEYHFRNDVANPNGVEGLFYRNGAMIVVVWKPLKGIFCYFIGLVSDGRNIGHGDLFERDLDRAGLVPGDKVCWNLPGNKMFLSSHCTGCVCDGG
jgi:hypothetical protein